MMRLLNVVRMLLTRFYLLLFAALFILCVPNAAPSGATRYERTLSYAKDILFDYITWTLDAIVHKLGVVHGGTATALPTAEQSAFVVAYLERVAQLSALNSQLERIYTDPNVTNPEAEAARVLAQRDYLKARIASEKSTFESIVEAQVATVLRDEGFTLLGEVFPPVSARFTELPMVLIVSPRERIEREITINTTFLSADQMTALEDQIDRELNVASLVVPIGGLALYPAMIIETANAAFILETIAHEWLHHYLYFFPLGLEYLNPNGEALIINETTASQFGKEVGRKAIVRFYSDYPQILSLLPPESAPETTPSPTPTPDPKATPIFDPGVLMNETRLRVDELLAQGKVAEAESYMEAQRRVFVANGYAYRKINQAFFAFYGGYQSPSGGGAGGADPIGPAVAAVRRASGSVQAWIIHMRGITSRQALLDLQNRLKYSSVID
ncbi:MAG: hypothetical protein OHK0023_20480 [Anaerolineae bacterium]